MSTLLEILRNPGISSPSATETVSAFRTYVLRTMRLLSKVDEAFNHVANDVGL